MNGRRRPPTRLPGLLDSLTPPPRRRAGAPCLLAAPSQPAASVPRPARAGCHRRPRRGDRLCAAGGLPAPVAVTRPLARRNAAGHAAHRRVCPTAGGARCRRGVDGVCAGDDASARLYGIVGALARTSPRLWRPTTARDAHAAVCVVLRTHWRTGGMRACGCLTQGMPRGGGGANLVPTCPSWRLARPTVCCFGGTCT